MKLTYLIASSLSLTVFGSDPIWVTVTGTNTLTVKPGYTAELASLLVNSSFSVQSSFTVKTPDGQSFNSAANNVYPFAFVGPAEIRLNLQAYGLDPVGQWYGFATFKLWPPVTDPETVAAAPSGKNSFAVVLEQSNDLVKWSEVFSFTTTNPPSPAFYRARIR